MKIDKFEFNLNYLTLLTDEFLRLEGKMNSEFDYSTLLHKENFF